MPIPVENTMIFRNIDGKKLFAHDIKLKLYYPNIYEVIGNDAGDDLTIYVFYSNDGDITTLKYQNELTLYYNFFNNILDRYKNNTIPDIIKKFQPTEFIYDINDYQHSLTFPDHLKYKVEQIKKFAQSDIDLLKVYLYLQTKADTSYYLDMSKVNLSAKYRTNNFTEITNAAYQTEFTEPRYVFIFRNEFKDGFFNFRIFIDGRLYFPDKAWKDGRFEYYYIPVSLIKPTTIIEIEKFEEVVFSKDVAFTSLDQSVIVELPVTSIDVCANDLMLVYRSDTEFIARDKFTFFTVIEDHRVEVPPDSFTVLKNFEVQIKDPTLIWVNLTLTIKKNAFSQEWKIDTVKDAVGVLYFDIDALNDPRHYRIFRNGQLLPQNIYNMSPTAEHYAIADWALSGNKLWNIPLSLWYYNPFSPQCETYFPRNRNGVIITRITEHCFYNPTSRYKET
jgi:hypothetical protein